MEVSEKQIFNLWDTNGRRGDVLNALQIYLGILKDLDEAFLGETWASYPTSLKQYVFYKRSVESSPDVFKDHPKLDEFEKRITPIRDEFVNRKWNRKRNEELGKILDEGIEARARHHTSNLVKLGFADEKRNITMAGYDLIRASLNRDALENLLPISDINVVLLRQLMKLRVYSKPNVLGFRQYYSPFFMSLYLLLYNKTIDKETFRNIVQGSSPYWNDSKNPKDVLAKCNDMKSFIYKNEKVPMEFMVDGLIDEGTFFKYIKNRKSTAAVPVYFEFYKSLYNFAKNRNAENYRILRSVIIGKGCEKLRKAFGYGEAIFDVGNKTRLYEYEEFCLKNDLSKYFQGNFNEAFYRAYSASKYIDQAKEYSDTTIRLLGATKLFKFGKALPELNFKEVFQNFFTQSQLESMIFGIVDENGFETGETQFGQNVSCLEVLNIGEDFFKQATKNVSKEELKERNQVELEQHIEEKYPREKIIEILRMFSDRKNDSEIKKAVNDEAPVPTIYEYIVAVAWYYISGKTISIYDSLNLTLNGDMEPVIHASGGAGDIVVDYPEYVVMLEVTLMNASAQKRGEWEPVLRHSINLNAETEQKTVITLFIADTLDYNTINIWRAVSMVPLQASNSDKIAENVTVAAFKNDELCDFLENDIRDTDIIRAVEKSFMSVKSDFDTEWRGNLLCDIRKEYYA